MASSAPDLPAAPVLAGEVVAFAGKLASLSRREAQAIVDRLGGTSVGEVTERTTMLVLGGETATAPARTWKRRRDEGLDQEALDRVRVVTEDDFCRLIGVPAPSDLRRQYHGLRDILARYPALREDQVRCLQKWQLVRPAVRTRGETYFAFADLAIIRRAHAELQQGTPFRAILRSLRTAREGQLTFDFHLDADQEKVVRLEAGPSPSPPASDAERRRAASGPTLAEQYFQVAASLDDGDPASRESAARAYRRALEADPMLVPALINLANIHYAREELVEAEALYERAIALSPAIFEAHFNLGNVHHDVGRLAEAEQCYREALRLNPDHADAHFYLAVTLEKIGLSQEAKPHWRAYQRLAPDGEWVELAREFSE